MDVVKTSQEAIDLLAATKYDCLLLDHDLEGPVYYPSGPRTGYEVAQWLAQNTDKQPTVVITHSQNPVGAENICRALPKAMAFPHCWELNALKEILEVIVEERKK